MVWEREKGVKGGGMFFGVEEVEVTAKEEGGGEGVSGEEGADEGDEGVKGVGGDKLDRLKATQKMVSCVG